MSQDPLDPLDPQFFFNKCAKRKTPWEQPITRAAKEAETTVLSSDSPSSDLVLVEEEQAAPLSKPVESSSQSIVESTIERIRQLNNSMHRLQQKPLPPVVLTSSPPKRKRAAKRPAQPMLSLQVFSCIEGDRKPKRPISFSISPTDTFVALFDAIGSVSKRHGIAPESILLIYRDVPVLPFATPLSLAMKDASHLFIVARENWEKQRRQQSEGIAVAVAGASSADEEAPLTPICGAGPSQQDPVVLHIKDSSGSAATISVSRDATVGGIYRSLQEKHPRLWDAKKILRFDGDRLADDLTPICKLGILSDDSLDYA